ncbi:MAG: hypothetical protein KR126chlam1_00251 [Chlamydiae bacterium]|nr:hypothetical protein [Chlamydiota bacterium]
MRFIFCLLSLFLAIYSYAKEEYVLTPEGTVSVTSDTKRLGASFNKFIIEKSSDSNLIPYGTVYKPYALTRTYVYTSKMGHPCSIHHAYLVSFGSLFDFLKEFEVTDEKGTPIGLIQGNWDSDQSALFYFFDDQNQLFAKATIDSSYSELSISTPEDQKIFDCKKTFVIGGNWWSDRYYWTIEKVNQTSFDERFLWPFISFVADMWWPGVTKFESF